MIIAAQMYADRNAEGYSIYSCYQEEKDSNPFSRGVGDPSGGGSGTGHICILVEYDNGRGCGAYYGCGNDNGGGAG